MGKVRFVESSEPIQEGPLIYSLPARVRSTSESVEHSSEPAPDPSGSDSTGETLHSENWIQADVKTRTIRLIVTPEMAHIIEASILRFVQNELGQYGWSPTEEQKQAIDVRLQLALRELLTITGEELEEFVNRLAQAADSLTLDEDG